MDDESIIEKLSTERAEQERAQYFGDKPNEPNKSGGPNVAGIDSETILQALTANEDGDANLFVRINRGRLCYDAEEGVWYNFAGPHWIEDRLNGVYDKNVGINT